jgi:hypothetical protein
VAGRPRRLRPAALVACGFALALTAAGGCAFGPRVLEKTHGRYNESVLRVDEEQLLRNIVRMRYNDSTFDLKVSSIAAQYELDGGAEARPFFLAPNPAGNTFRSFTRVLPDVTLSGANRPTITFIPGDSGEAVERFLTPITTETLVFLFQSSWPVSTVLRLWVERLNGVPNASASSGPPPGAVPDFARFQRIAELAQTARQQKLATIHPEERDVEVGGALPAENVDAAALVDAAKNGLEYRRRDDGKTWALVRRERRLVVEVVPEALGHPVLNEMGNLLNLQPGRTRYEIQLSHGVTPDPMLFPGAKRDEMDMSTRSTVQVWYYLSNGVDVPPEHMAEGLAVSPVGPDGTMFDNRVVTDGLFRVHVCSGHKPPSTAYIAVKHRGYWFYIDDRDQASKSTFSLVFLVSRLDFARQQPAAPLLTLPIGR